MLSQSVHRRVVNTPWAFAACFAFVQTPANRIFITGGIGDDETTKRTIEIVKEGRADGGYNINEDSDINYGHVVKESMNYKHVDHSMCFLTDQYLFVTGSYI